MSAVRAVDVLRGGGVVACATETLQGLLADALDPEAVARVVALKGRGPEPIALLLPDVESVARVAAVPLAGAALEAARRHWPGPLTLVLPARPGLPPPIAPRGTVGVRVPGPSPALTLVRAFGGPLTATSANPSGRPAARTAAEVRAYFSTGLDLVVEADAPGGAPSTVAAVDDQGGLRVLRPGAVPVR